jgi:DnaJ-domain-containing protein 1
VPNNDSHNAGHMKLDSKIFDHLRVKPDEDRLLRDTAPKCEWESCDNPGLYPAPKGRGMEGKYHRFCLDHVREYNKGYNYFSGVPDEEVVAQQKADQIGDRPTWFVGVNAYGKGKGRGRGQRGGYGYRFETKDPFGLFGEKGPAGEAPGKIRRPIKRLERKALRQLNLEDTATKQEIKARFKELVKRLHPDHNNGDRSSEDKLREVIQAYNYLRQAGLA